MKHLRLYENLTNLNWRDQYHHLERQIQGVKEQVIARIEERVRELLTGLEPGRKIVLWVEDYYSLPYYRHFGDYDDVMDYYVKSITLVDRWTHILGQGSNGNTTTYDPRDLEIECALDLLDLLEALGTQAEWLAKQEGTEMGFFTKETTT